MSPAGPPHESEFEWSSDGVAKATVARSGEHPVFAATWNAPDPWPICLDCDGRVYMDPSEGWRHWTLPFTYESQPSLLGDET